MLRIIRISNSNGKEQKTLVADNIGTINAFINVVYNNARALGVDSTDIRLSAGNRNARSIDGKYVWTAVEA
jgi:hypothetical protein